VDFSAVSSGCFSRSKFCSELTFENFSARTPQKTRDEWMDVKWRFGETPQVEILKSQLATKFTLYNKGEVDF